MHPNPLRSSLDHGAYFKYAGIMVDRADFASVVASMDYSMENVTPELYLDAALDIIETNAFLRDEVDWPTVREAADASIGNGDPLPGIDIALQALNDAGDTHSYRWDASQLDTYVDTGAADLPPTQLPTGVALTDRIGYINLPPMQGNESAAERYATTGNTALADADSPNTCGWVIDLRSNFGGNSDPMIAAVGPLLGNGAFGGFAYSDDSTTYQAYADGSVYPADGSPGDPLIDGDIYQVANPDAAVAILIGPVTGSAGEYTGIAFHSRDHTHYFGEPTSDLTTGISGFLLADGAAIGLATSAMIDRNGITFPEGIQPDVTVPFEERTIGDPSDPVIAAAITWLLDQPPCQ
jgi:C-terminal processing protease CtpA/Prc